MIANHGYDHKRLGATDTAVYLGAVCYQAQDSLLKVQEEAELALKSARLQGHSGWFLYEKQLDEEQSSKGTVRWRTLIGRRIEEHGIDFYVQPVQQERGLLELASAALRGRAVATGHWVLAPRHLGIDAGRRRARMIRPGHGSSDGAGGTAVACPR